MERIAIGSLLVGVVVVVGVALAITEARAHPPLSEVELAMSREQGLSNQDFETLSHLARGPGRKEMSAVDFALVDKIAKKGNPDARTHAMAAMRLLPPTSKYRAQAIADAKAYLAENRGHGMVSSIIVLKNLNDPAWVAAATTLSHNPDPSESEIGRRLLKSR